MGRPKSTPEHAAAREIERREYKKEWIAKDRASKVLGQPKPKRGRPIIPVEHNGEKHSLSEWARIIDVSREVLQSRIRLGWSVAEALTQGNADARYQNFARTTPGYKS